MANRTTQTVVHFSSPFRLPGFDEPQPAGDYRVERDEEAIEGLSRLAWRSVGAFIHLPALAAQGSTRQMVPMSQTDLEVLIEKDQQKP